MSGCRKAFVPASRIRPASCLPSHFPDPAIFTKPLSNGDEAPEVAMWLINTATLQLSPAQFYEPKIPPYAILSHTWDEEEVTFGEVTSSSKGYLRKKGWAKIQRTCELAQEDGLIYAWVDTCCIDKSSSAELSEAINSMYRWYSNAKVCYAWLADLPPLDQAPLEESLPQCRWWTRGWTLQELIAPVDVLFYDQFWNKVGERFEWSERISDITGIHQLVFLSERKPEQYSVAQRMSWAASRTTTRVEDMAYSLMGIFDVNMPLLYGEGEKAFTRLQEHVLARSNDVTILAWPPGWDSIDNHVPRPPLATSPSAFHRCVSINSLDEWGSYKARFKTTSAGLEVRGDVEVWDGNPPPLRFLFLVGFEELEDKVPNLSTSCCGYFRQIASHLPVS